MSWPDRTLSPAVSTIAYRIRRSPRARRVRVTVDAAHGVEVVLPARAPERAADAAVIELRPWIERRVAEIERLREQIAARGDTVPYLGTELRLVAQAGRRRVAWRREAGELLVPADGDERRAALERWYRRQARVRRGRTPLRQADHPRPEDALGQLLARRPDELQLAAAARPGAGARLRRVARGLPPEGDGPLAALLGPRGTLVPGLPGPGALVAPARRDTRAVRALAIVHQADAGPGVFAEAVEQAGWELAIWEIGAGSGAPSLEGLDAVMTFGGSAHPDQTERYPWIDVELRWLADALAADVPLLGVCLGAQLLAVAAGGAAGRAPQPEIGWHPVRVCGSEDPVLGCLAPEFEAFSWHAYECTLPPGAMALARSQVCLQAYRVGRCAWGIQFHAEVSYADALGWIEDYAADPDAVRAGVDPVALQAATEPRIAAWNDVGRELCRRFLEVAATPEAATHR
jgi:GMP synthase-like glutamine amidotransferase